MTNRFSGWKIKKTITPYLFILPTLVGMAIVTLYPILRGFQISFLEWNISNFLSPVKPFVGLRNYQMALNDPVFWLALKNTALYSFITVPSQVALALFIAVLLNQKMLRGKSALRVAYFLPVITPWVIVALIWKWLFAPELGFINYMLQGIGLSKVNWLHDPTASVVPGIPTSLLSVMIMTVWQGIGWAMVILLAGLQTIRQELYEAAAIDGANAWKRFLYVTIPCLRPTLLVVTVSKVMGTFQVFTPVRVLTAGGPADSSNVLYLKIYQEGFEYLNFDYASAIAFFVFFIIMTLTLIQFRLFRTEEV